MKKWISENWDEAVVYAFALFGAVWGILFQIITAPKPFSTLESIFWSGLAPAVSFFAVWAAENAGMAKAASEGKIKEAKDGRRKNLRLRLGRGLAFAFGIQISLPFLLPAAGTLISNFLLGALKAMLGGAP